MLIRGVYVVVVIIFDKALVHVNLETAKESDLEEYMIKSFK